MEVLEHLLEIEDPSEASWIGVFHRLMIDMQKTPEDLEIAESICQILLRKLEEVGCSNKNIAWNIVQVIVLWREIGFFLIPTEFHPSGNISKPTTPSLYSTVVHKCSDSYMLELRRSCNMSLDSIRSCDVMLQKIFLKNGLMQLHDMTTRDDFEAAKDTIWDIRLSPKLEGLVPESPNGIDSKIRLLRLLRKRFLNGRTVDVLRGFKRIMLISECMRVLRKPRGLNTAEKYVECVRLYFRGVEDPTVGADEVREFIQFFLVDLNEAAVDSLVTVYRSLFPESDAPYGPRSLKHLCRCTVRKSLSEKSEVLPELLKNLLYPNSLKMYILGNY